jgi:SAM-dependent methyltransferase
MHERPRDEHYDAQYFPAMFAAEDRHFWFVHRNRVIAAVTRRLWRARAGRGGSVLEVGCGTGNVLRELQRECPGARLVVGMEPFIEGLGFARRRTAASLVCARIEQLPFLAPFALIGMFDVLEHIPDDRAALRALHAQLEPGGSVLITVPAHQSLWGRFDEASGHVRRYSCPALRAVLEEAGFSVDYLTEFMSPLFPLVWAGRRLVGRASDTGDPVRRELAVPPLLNRLMLAVLEVERRWLSRPRHLPIGTSILALATRG